MGCTLAGLPSEHRVVGHALSSPEFVAELRSGYWAVAVGMSRHQLPGEDG